MRLSVVAPGKVTLGVVALGMVAALFGVAAFSRPAAARSNDCILDDCSDRQPVGDEGGGGFRRNGAGPRGSSRPGVFDFYVLSLSWSPGFCATGGAERAKDQCRAGAELGFVVHGLWPQYERGYPSDCRGATSPSVQALAKTAGVYPSEGLARYEWRKHGTCSGLSPSEYFAEVKDARDGVVIPSAFKDPHADKALSPLDVERAFTDANPRLRPGMLAAICKDGVLDEVRICMSKDLQSFQACPGVVRERCRGGSLDVPPVR